MSAIRDIAINVLAYPITFALGLFANVIYRWFSLRGDRKLWRPFLGKGSLAVILTDKPGPRTPKVSVTEVQAFSDLRGALHALGREVELQIGSLANFRTLRNCPFICLGGPLANPATKQVLDSVNGLPVSFNEADKSFRTSSANPYKEIVDPATGQTVTDFGLILKLTKLNKDATDSCPVLIVFGTRGSGTEDAVRALLYHNPLRQEMSKKVDDDYYALLKFNKLNTVHPWQVVSSGSFRRT